MPAALDCIRHCGGHDGASLRPKALAVVDAALQLQQAGFSSLGCSGSRGAAEQHAVEMRGDGGGRFISCTQNEGSSSTVTAKQVPAQRDAGVDVVGQQRERGAVAALQRLESHHLALSSRKRILCPVTCSH